TSPQAPLHIASSGTWTSNGWDRNLILDGGANPTIQIGYGADERWGIANGAGKLYFFTSDADDASDSASYHMAINGSTGNMTVGSSVDSSSQLHVEGNMS